MSIPIRNIYYLLFYVWNKVEYTQKTRVNLDKIDIQLDLFAKLLIEATEQILKRGIDRNYQSRVEEVNGIRGKINVSETVKSNLIYKQKTICEFETFSSNTILNRILFTTLKKLSKTKDLDHDLRFELIELTKKFGQINEIRITNTLFSQIKLNRNNRIYSIVLNICQFVYQNSIPNQEEGNYIFTDFTRDENKMPLIFESFVRSFYQKEQSRYPIVRRENITWKLESMDLFSSNYIPRMQTDVTLENFKEKIIIDLKYSKETLSKHYSSEKIKSNNLYQLFSYIVNQDTDSDKSKNTVGILLYPTIDKTYDLTYKYLSHEIKIRTVDLNSDWKLIHQRLLDIIE